MLRYKDRASARMLEIWNEWLQVPEARSDPGYSAIEGVVRQFWAKETRSAEESQTPKRKKKAKSRKTRN